MAPSVSACPFWYPHQELNLDQRFRKPLLYPFELWGQACFYYALVKRSGKQFRRSLRKNDLPNCQSPPGRFRDKVRKLNNVTTARKVTFAQRADRSFATFGAASGNHQRDASKRASCNCNAKRGKNSAPRNHSRRDLADCRMGVSAETVPWRAGCRGNAEKATRRASELRGRRRTGARSGAKSNSTSL